MLVDAHCHLGAGTFDEDRATVVERARVAGVEHIVVIGTDLEDSTQASEFARAQPGLSATAGLHPHEAAVWSPAVREALRALVARPEVRAVGETGLDYHYDHAPRDAQRRAFDGQLALAAEVGKPVVVHARDADADVCAALRTWGERIPAVILHSFSAGPAVFETGLAIAAYFSFSGLITFKNWAGTEYVRACPFDRLLVETDAPYLAPVPHRGRRNEPAFVREVALAAAQARGITLEDVARETTRNAHRAFGGALAPLGSASPVSATGS